MYRLNIAKIAEVKVDRDRQDNACPGFCALLTLFWTSYRLGAGDTHETGGTCLYGEQTALGTVCCALDSECVLLRFGFEGLPMILRVHGELLRLGFTGRMPAGEDDEGRRLLTGRAVLAVRVGRWSIGP